MDKAYLDSVRVCVCVGPKQVQIAASKDKRWRRRRQKRSKKYSLTRWLPKVLLLWGHWAMVHWPYDMLLFARHLLLSFSTTTNSSSTGQHCVLHQSAGSPVRDQPSSYHCVYSNGGQKAKVSGPLAVLGLWRNKERKGEGKKGKKRCFTRSFTHSLNHLSSSPSSSDDDAGSNVISSAQSHWTMNANFFCLSVGRSVPLSDCLLLRLVSGVRVCSIRCGSALKQAKFGRHTASPFLSSSSSSPTIEEKSFPKAITPLAVIMILKGIRRDRQGKGRSRESSSTAE